MKNIPGLICLLGILGSSACIPLLVGDMDEGPEPLIQDPAWVDYLEHVKAQPLGFQLPASEDAEAWTRAQDILAKYGRHKEWCSKTLQVSTSNVIEIDVRPRERSKFEDVGFLFRIVRAPRENTVDYTITYAPLAERNPYLAVKAHAQAIAFYIVSGKFMKHVWRREQFDVRAHDWEAM